MIDAPAGMQHQAQGWLSWLYQVSGELYYQIDLDFPTAFNSQRSLGGYGDGTLMYPGLPSASGGNPGIGGADGIPLPSYRLKMMREGLGLDPIR